MICNWPGEFDPPHFTKTVDRINIHTDRHAQNLVGSMELFVLEVFGWGDQLRNVSQGGNTLAGKAGAHKEERGTILTKLLVSRFTLGQHKVPLFAACGRTYMET